MDHFASNLTLRNIIRDSAHGNGIKERKPILDFQQSIIEIIKRFWLNYVIAGRIHRNVLFVFR